MQVGTAGCRYGVPLSPANQPPPRQRLLPLIVPLGQGFVDACYTPEREPLLCTSHHTTRERAAGNAQSTAVSRAFSLAYKQLARC